MYANKVKITSETRERLNNSVLSPAKKRLLREELIKERIRNTPDGLCTKQELVAAAGLDPDGRSNEYARGVGMLNSMVKRGIISHDKTSKFRKAWAVKEDVKVKPTPREVAEKVIPKEVRVALKDYETVDSMNLVDMAKEFAWRENSDSLREFIAYVENAIK